jgi:hypothetical protein
MYPTLPISRVALGSSTSVQRLFVLRIAQEASGYKGGSNVRVTLLSGVGVEWRRNAFPMSTPASPTDAIAIVATMDTKSAEVSFVSDIIARSGREIVLVDVGTAASDRSSKAPQEREAVSIFCKRLSRQSVAVM